MVFLTRIEHFNAAHKLYNPAWTREKNEEVFGVCANENWHGHNYELYVTVKGDPDPDTGFLFDVKKLSDIIKDQVLEKLEVKRSVLLVEAAENRNLTLASRNLERVTTVPTRELNVYDLLSHKQVLLTEPAARKLSEALAK